jgi:hypothetical protein
MTHHASIALTTESGLKQRLSRGASLCGAVPACGVVRGQGAPGLAKLGCVL